MVSNFPLDIFSLKHFDDTASPERWFSTILMEKAQDTLEGTICKYSKNEGSHSLLFSVSHGNDQETASPKREKKKKRKVTF